MPPQLNQQLLWVTSMKSRLSTLVALGLTLATPHLLWLGSPSLAQPSPTSQIQQLIQQSKEQSRQGNFAASIDTLQQLLTLTQQQNNQELEAWSLLGLGFNYNKTEQYQQALASYNRALAIYQKTNAPTGVATTLSNLATVYLDMGQPNEALNYYQQALTIFTELGDQTGVERTQNNIDEVNQRLQ